MFYAIKLGPLETEEEGKSFVFVGFADERMVPVVFAKRNEAGLRGLLEYAEGHELRCEVKLARAGKKLGYVSGPPPDWVLEGRALLAYRLGLGEYFEVITDPGVLPLLLSAMANFVDAEPWRWWGDSVPLAVSVAGSTLKTYEACIMGAGGIEFGMALYENRGAVQRIIELIDAGDTAEAAREPCISVTMKMDPDWAAEAVDAGFGTLGMPIPMKRVNGETVEIDAVSLAVLAAALQATSELTPDNLLEVAEAQMEEGRVRVTVEAPADRSESDGEESPRAGGTGREREN